MTTEGDEYEWAETHGDGAENHPPPGEGWEHVAAVHLGGRDVTRWRRKAESSSALRCALVCLLEKWTMELRKHPPTAEGRFAAMAQAYCIQELRAVMEHNRCP